METETENSTPAPTETQPVPVEPVEKSVEESVEKPIGGRVPYSPSTPVWNKLDPSLGPWVVGEDTGGDTVKLYDKGGEPVDYPAALLTDIAPETPKKTETPKKKMKIPPVWLGVAILLIAVAGVTGHVLSEGNFRWAWGSGTLVFAVVVFQRLYKNRASLA